MKLNPCLNRENHILIYCSILGEQTFQGFFCFWPLHFQMDNMKSYVVNELK